MKVYDGQTFVKIKNFNFSRSCQGPEYYIIYSFFLFFSRRMFPGLKFSITGLHPSKRYTISIEVRPADKYRYKYHDLEWCITGKAFTEMPRHQRMCIHSQSPSTGYKWTSNVVSFHKLKITNNTLSSGPNQVCLFCTLCARRRILRPERHSVPKNVAQL